MIAGDARPAAADAGFLEVLRRADFLRLWIAQIVSSVGDRFYQFALLYVVLESGRAQGVGVGREGAQVLFVAMLPTVVLAPWIGRWVDKFPRRALLAISEWGRAAVVAGLLAVWWSGAPKAWLLALVSCGGLLTGLFIPARQAAVPALVEPAQLVRANALMTFVGIAGSVVGAGAAVLVTALGETASFLIGAAGFSVSGFVIARMRSALAPGESGAGAASKGLRRALDSTLLTLEALRGLWRERPVRLLACLLACFHGVSAFFVIVFFEHAAAAVDFSPVREFAARFSPEAAARVESWQFPGTVVLVVASGIGLLAGLLLVGRTPRVAHWGGLPVLMFFALGAVCWALSGQQEFLPVLLLCAATGLIGSLITIPVDARWQQEVDAGHHGKLFAAKNALVSTAFLAGLAVNLDGRLLAWRGASQLLSDLGLLCLAAGTALVLLWRGDLLGRWGDR